MSWSKKKAGWGDEAEDKSTYNFTVSGIIKNILEMVPGGVIRAGKTAYADDTHVGFWLGIDTDGLAKLNIGGVVAGVARYLKWTGAIVEVAGNIVAASITGILKLLDATTTFENEANPGTATGWVGLYDPVSRRGKWLGYDGGVLQTCLDSDGAIRWAGGKGTLNRKGWEYVESEDSRLSVSSTATQAMVDVATNRAFGVHATAATDGSWSVWGEGLQAEGVGVRGDAYGDEGVGVYGAASGSDGVGVIASATGEATVALRVYGGIADGGMNRYTKLGDALADTDALNRRTADGRYVALGGGGTGDVTGPASATDGNVVVFNGATGKAIKDGGHALSEYALSGHTHSAPGGVVPVGGIIMWSGAVATIPSNWALCDGNNSTPDLRDRFIVGARQDDAGAAKTNVTGMLTQSGGAVSHHHADHMFTQPGNHSALSHSGGAVDAHAGTAVSAHSGTAVGDHASGTTGQASAGATSRGSTASTLTLATHTHSTPALTHTVTQPSAHTVTQPNDHTFTQPSSHSISAHSGGAVDAHDTLSAPQPYFALAFIMRTA